MNLIELLRRRSSAHAFAESAISDAELRHLVSYGGGFDPPWAAFRRPT